MKEIRKEEKEGIDEFYFSQTVDMDVHHRDDMSSDTSLGSEAERRDWHQKFAKEVTFLESGFLHSSIVVE